MASKGGESRQGLIITLIFFVLATIILGVTTYLGFDGQAQLLAEAKKATAEAKKWEDDTDWARYVALHVRAHAGVNLSKDEMDTFRALRDKFDKGDLQNRSRDKNKDAVVKMLKDLDQSPITGWNDQTKEPKTTMRAHIDKLTKDLADAAKNNADQKADLDDANKKVLAAQQEWQKARATYDVNLNKLKDDHKTEQKNLYETIAALNKQIEGLGDDKTKLQEAQAVEKEAATKALNKANKDKADLIIRVEKAEEKVSASSVSVLDFDTPKGKVTQISPDGRTVFIDLGSADGVKTGLTFGIFGVGTNGKPIQFDAVGADGRPIFGSDARPVKEGKGTGEVMAVLGPHQSQVRITSLRDPRRDPVLRGDLLFNPAWNPNLRQHVAIAGIVDFAGDNVDSMQEFLRNLERQNVIVDAYLDSRDLSIKGKGISRQTDLLILGTAPEFDGVVREEDPKFKRRTEIIALTTKMQEDAKLNGVTVISLRKFLIMSGYNLPKTTVRSSGSSRPPSREKNEEAPKEKPAEKEAAPGEAK